jgi:hypothetical protein
MILVNFVVSFVVYSQLALCLFEKLPTHILFGRSLHMVEIHKQEKVSYTRLVGSLIGRHVYILYLGQGLLQYKPIPIHPSSFLFSLILDIRL